MTARLDSVCKFLCERSGWTLSNLKLQKLLYMAQLLYIGRTSGQLLMDANFEAWDYGPVEPSVYQKVKYFGSGAISDVFCDALEFGNEDPRKFALVEVYDALKDRTPGELVDITHWPKGAWAKHYTPNVKGVPIPNKDIHDEYFARLAQAQR